MISTYRTGRELFGHFEPLDVILNFLQEFRGEDILFLASKLNLIFFMDRGLDNKAVHDLIAGDLLDHKPIISI